MTAHSQSLETATAVCFLSSSVHHTLQDWNAFSSPSTILVATRSHSSGRHGILYLVREDRHSDVFLKDTPLSDNLAVTPHLIRSCRVCVLTIARGGIAPYAMWRTHPRSAMLTARSGRPRLHNRKARCKSSGISLYARFNTSVWGPES